MISSESFVVAKDKKYFAKHNANITEARQT